jgi:hypothetical protein
VLLEYDNGVTFKLNNVSWSYRFKLYTILPRQKVACNLKSNCEKLCAAEGMVNDIKKILKIIVTVNDFGQSHRTKTGIHSLILELYYNKFHIISSNAACS